MQSQQLSCEPEDLYDVWETNLDFSEAVIDYYKRIAKLQSVMHRVEYVMVI